MVYFHDFGKATIYFQHRIIEAALRENPELNNLDEGYIAAFRKRFPEFDIKQALAGNPRLGAHAELGAITVQASLETTDVLLRAVLLEVIKRHHGDLHNFCQDEFDLLCDVKDQLKQQWGNTNLEDYAQILSPQGLALPNGFEDLVEDYGGVDFFLDIDDALPTADIQPYLFTLFMFSLLLAADKGDMMLAKGREQVGEAFCFPADAVPVYKAAVFGDSPVKPIDVVREEAFHLVEAHVRAQPSAPFYAITLPTGLGKTFTAFNAAFVLQNLIADSMNYKPKIIYCLPFTSVIDQNAAILEDVLKHSGLEEGFLARHHYLSDWSSQKGGNNELSYSEKEYFTEGWEYPFTVTTFVQLLETIFSNKNRKLRKFHNLVNAIIVLDEVQNISAEYFETVEVMFQAMHDYFNTRFVFVTATQPYLIANSEVVELTDPLKERTRRFFTEMNRIKLDVSLWQEGAQPLDELQVKFQAAIEANPKKSFLFILNKVKASQNLFHYLQCENPEAEMVYLSAAVLPVLRKERIEKIKSHKEGKQLIIVSTQVVEAGVDIDLDIVYRDLAPLDSINQSAGRCNRNGLNELGEVRLFEMEKGYVRVYDETLINATRIVIKEMVEKLGDCVIPERNFYDLNQSYADHIRRKVADNSAKSELIGRMKRLEFEEVSKNFKVIEKQQFRYSVFIDFCEEAHAIWEIYQQKVKISDRWERKKELRILRPKLLQYVVQFPDYALPEEHQNDDVAIIRLDQNTYPSCYDLITGYKQPQKEPPNKAVFC